MQECKCTGINRHVVGDERALQERSSDSVLLIELAIDELYRKPRGKAPFWGSLIYV